jgi:hypothetical protein
LCRHKIIEDRPRTPLSFALCPTCRCAAELAEQLSGDPATRSPGALQLLNCAFDALGFVAPKLIETGEVATFDQLSLRALVRHLGQLGATARWVNRFVPSIQAEAAPGTCTRYRFAHLKIGQRHELRAAYAARLKERVARNAPRVKIPPPPVTDSRSGSARLVLISDGCLVCGIGTQSMSASEWPSRAG